MGLLVPLIVRALGLIHGIVVTQVIAALVLIVMAVSGNGSLAIALYLVFSAAQWASSPVLYNLLMNRDARSTPEHGGGHGPLLECLRGDIRYLRGWKSLFTRFGYKPVLLGIAGLRPRCGSIVPDPDPAPAASYIHCNRSCIFRGWQQMRATMKRIAAALLIVIAARATHAKDAPQKRVELLCHRTANEDVPENTLESLKQAALPRMRCRRN